MVLEISGMAFLSSPKRRESFNINSYKMQGKIYFGVGTHKNCFRQMQENPKVEICVSDGKGFLRYYGKAVFVESPEILKKAFETADYLPKMYNEKTGHKLGCSAWMKLLRSFAASGAWKNLWICKSYEFLQKGEGLWHHHSCRSPSPFA